MWRAANGQFHKGQLKKLGFSRSSFWECESHLLHLCRHNSSAPAFGPENLHEFTDVGLHLHTRATYSQLRSFPAKSHGDLLCSSATPLEQSLSTLDAALSSVVQFPLLTHPLLQVMPESSRGRMRIDHRWPFQLKAVATAAEDLDLEEVLPDPEELHDHLAPIYDIDKTLRAAKAKSRRLYNRQRKLELDAWDQAVKEYKKLMAEMCRKKLAPNLPFAKSLMLSWFEPVRDGIAAELKAIRDREPGEDRASYGPYLHGSELTADILAVITMHKLMAIMMQDLDNGCIRLANTAIIIGDVVEQEAKLRRALKKSPKKKKKGTLEIDAEKDEQKEFLQKKLKEMSSKRPGSWKVKKLLNAYDFSQGWPTYIQAKVGCRLLEIVLSNTHVNAPVSHLAEDGTELRPAFKHILKIPKRGGMQRSYGAVLCDPYLRSQIDSSARFMVMPYMPMLVPPRPWKGYTNGGYLHLRSNIMRTHGSKQQREAVRNTPRAQLQEVFQALDTLGTTCWKINKDVLDVMEQIWKDGGRLGDLVDRDDVSPPPKPQTDDMTEIRAWRKALSKVKRINGQRHSQRCDIELKLAVARTLRDEEEFYYPHNLDFRGRAYPMHPHLNHLGSDICRGILQFSKGRRLGEAGLRWIKIHIANLYANGADKLPFEGRVAFADSHLENILDSADNPLESSRWWLEAEDPFQCLAACIDLRNALNSPNVQEYISHLPVHQDGSCNGLQHYAALGRDRNGAQAVNLTTGDAPADVYSGIASRVRAIVEEDSLKDPATYPNAGYARLLMGHVDRKLVKQTVMTSVYGVTFIGARQQITSRLKEKGCIAEEALMYRTGCYAAKVTLSALGEMFKEARCIMNWLGDCAKVIAADGEAVRWVTPLGLPVVQPYRRPGKQVVRTTLQQLVLRTDSDQPVMSKRQRSAFPPNFVHSMDGSHMMMTAVACQNAGLAFAGVHDSFWTHAGDVDRMNVILREKFVELYKQPILENLLESFEKKFPRLKFPPLPERGDLDLDEVLKAQYFFN